jgi:hypothetical protein
MDIECQTELIVRKMDVMYHDISSLLNRSAVKKWLSDLEKIVSKEFPDFIVLRGCCRYVLFELHRKEWCKYYFLSVSYEPNQPVTRSHLVLSRYPFMRNENFGTRLSNHMIQVKIPFNDVPMRYEYEDLDVQQIDTDTITIIVTDVDRKSETEDLQLVSNVIQNVCTPTNPPTVLLFGMPTEETFDNWKTTETLQYLSDAWECTEMVERTGTHKFELIQFD